MPTEKELELFFDIMIKIISWDTRLEDRKAAVLEAAMNHSGEAETALTEFVAWFPEE